jgi:hypothetical protein
MTDAVVTPIVLREKPMHPPIAPTIEQQDTMGCLPAGHQLLVAPVTENKCISSWKIEAEDHSTVQVNAQVDIPADFTNNGQSRILPAVEKPKHGDQDPLELDYAHHDDQSHPSNSIDTTTYWDEAMWAFDYERALVGTNCAGDGHSGEGPTEPSGYSENDDFSLPMEGVESSTEVCTSRQAPSPDLEEVSSSEYDEQRNFRNVATNTSTKTESIALLEHHRSLSQGVMPETIPHPPEPIESNRFNVSITNDTENVEVIVIEDSSDEAEDIDVTADRRTWRDLHRRACSGSLRSQDGMIPWSDVRFERANWTVVKELWIEIQVDWMSVRELQCFVGSKNVEKFNKTIIHVDKRTRQNGGVMSFPDAGRLLRRFKRMVPLLQKRSQRGRQQRAVKHIQCILTSLYEEVNMAKIIEEHPMSDGDSADEAYMPNRGIKERRKAGA